jgi:hypothetical protein
MDTKKKKFETKQGAATTADLSQQDLHEEVVNSTVSLGHKPTLAAVLPGGKSAELDPNPNSDCQDLLGRRLVVRV